MSHCGNFALLGFSNGEVHSFNLQSGRHLGTFVADAEYRALLTRPTKKLESWGRAHDAPVTGLAVDACGDVLVSGGGSGLRFWNMRTREPVGDATALPAGVTSLVWSKASDLIAVVCEDFGVYIYDAGTRKLARRLIGHTGAVTDVAFDSEGRRVVTSAMDGSIKTWDLPSGRAIDTLRCETAPTSVAVGPGGEFIASCHVNSLSVSLWVDQSKFGGPSRNWALSDDRNGDKESGDSDASSDASGDCARDAKMDSDADGSSCKGEDKDVGDNGVSSLASDLITLSGRPTTQWTTLANLDAIKQRNKPIQLPKKPEQMPFFLPNLKASKPKLDIEVVEHPGHAEQGGKPAVGGSKPLFGDGDDFFGNSEFGSLVASGNYAAASKLLSSLGPSGLDVELRTLEGAQSRLGAAQYFTEKLETRCDFEINQALLDVFLKAHGRELAQDEGGSEVLSALAKVQDKSWSVLRTAFDSVLTLSSHFAGHV
jgi:U3 small nucleolar RNA-associated protein 21